MLQFIVVFVSLHVTFLVFNFHPLSSWRKVAGVVLHPCKKHFLLFVLKLPFRKFQWAKHNRILHKLVRPRSAILFPEVRSCLFPLNHVRTDRRAQSHIWELTALMDTEKHVGGNFSHLVGCLFPGLGESPRSQALSRTWKRESRLDNEQ